MKFKFLNFRLLLTALCLQSIQAQTQAITENPSLQEKSRLPISSPFFLPYRGDVQIGIGASYLTSRVRTVTPPQNFIGVQLKGSDYVSNLESVPVTTSLLIGFSDRFSLGLSQTIRADWTHTDSGPSYNTSEYKFPDASGFSEPVIGMAGRFAGTQGNQIYVDLGLSYAPGIASKANNTALIGRHRGTATLSIGTNIRSFSAGIIGTGIFASSAVVNNIAYSQSLTIAASFFAQQDISFIYLRGLYAQARFVNTESGGDPFSKKTMHTLGAEIGLKISNRAVWNISTAYTFQIESGDYYTGYMSALRVSATVGPTQVVATSFSYCF